MKLHWIWFHAALVNAPTTLLQTIHQGMDTNHSDCLGNTALHLAAYKGHHACVELLICYGAQVNVNNELDQTPLDLAVEYQQLHCVKPLLQYGSEVTQRALHIAASRGLTHILFALLCMRPTAIEQACRCARKHGHVQLANHLMKHPLNDELFCGVSMTRKAPTPPSIQTK